MRLRRMLVIGVVVVLLVVCSSDDKKAATVVSPSASSSSSPAAPTTIQVQAGINDPASKPIAVLQFMPATVTVPVNTAVNWTWEGAIEPHSVTFLKPGQVLPDPGSDPSLFAPTPPTGPYDGTTFVNSGLAPLGPAPAPPFSVSFSKPGTYQYFCVIHPQMVGKVVVEAAGGQTDTPQQVFDRGNAEKQQWLTEGENAAKDLAKAAASTDNGDGTKTWRVEMGVSTPHTDVLAFSQPPAMKAGDTLQFVNSSGAPHTATFSGSEPPIQDPSDPRTDPAAPGPSPQTLNATGFFNTGLLPPNAPPGAGPPEAVRTYSYVVPTAGTFAYYCILHATSGMAGEVTAT